MLNKFSSICLLSLLTTTCLAGGIDKAPSTKGFSGFYVGAGAGVNSVYATDSFVTSRASGLGGDADSNRYTYTSVLYAIQVGYGWQFANHAYLGLEGLVTYSPLFATDETAFSTAAGNVLIIGHNSIHTTGEPVINIDAVFGYTMCSRVLPFLEVGVTFAELTRQYDIKRTRTNVVTNTNVGYSTTINQNQYNTEYNIGVGLRRLFGQHLVMSTTLMYSDYGQVSKSSSVAIPGANDTETHSRTVSSYALSLFGTLSYLFN